MPTVAENPKGDRSAQVKTVILKAAARQFTEHGFEATGVRDIAAEAGVNPAIVIRHFGSKEGLFLQAMTLPQTWNDALDGPLDQLGVTMVRDIAEARGEGFRVYATLLQASGRPEVGNRLRAGLGERLVSRIAARLDGSDANARAHVFITMLIGLLTAMSVHEDPYLLTAPAAEIAERYGTLMQAALVGTSRNQSEPRGRA